MARLPSRPARRRVALRVAVYSDDVYRRTSRGLCSQLSFPQFIAGLAPFFEALTLIGRLDPEPGPCRHPLPAGIGVVGLETYSGLTSPRRLLGLLWRSLPKIWQALDDADTLVVMGPHPLVLLLVPIALLRRRRLVLGVRQHYPSYIAARHPGRFAIRWSARALEWVFRAMSRFVPVVVVGPGIAAQYAHAPRLHDLRVSLVGEAEVGEPQRDYSHDLRVLSVGRLDPDKNPLLLAQIAADLAADGQRWRLTVCGEGALRDDLERAIAELGVEDRVDLAGFVTSGDLARCYHEAHFLLHVAYTEGVPQVLYEAFSTGLPVVATDVGGVRQASDGAASLIPPADAKAAVGALRRLAEDPGLRRRFVEAGLRHARDHSCERELARLAAFLRAE